MSGERYLPDTNAVIAVLRGNTTLLERLREAEWVGISILTQIEFLAFPDLSEEDKQYFNQFLERLDVVGLDRTQTELVNRIIKVRKQHRLKLPDAIIVASALQNSAALVTDDQQLRSLPTVVTIGSN